MPGESGLSKREDQILQAVVQCYITTAEPVGSRTIVKRFGLDLSPATVRNVMADLEESGYLQQLHTSSGRVPTDQGYRYYVDHLMRVQQLTLAERTRIERELSGRLEDADEALRQTSQLLALVAHQAGIVEVPDSAAAEVRYIEVIRVVASRAALLIADNHGRVHTVMVPIEEALQETELTSLNNFLNQHLRGVTFDNLAALMHETMRSHLHEERRLAEQALHLLNLMPAGRRGQLYLEGTTALFEQPEFRDVDKAREVFGVLEERDRLVELLRRRMGGRGQGVPQVLIGSESLEPGFKEISVVASPYRVGSETVGVLGVLGPRRMPYGRLTSIVDYTAGILSRLLTRLAG